MNLSLAIKRIVDLLAGTLMLLVLAPVMLAVAVAIRRDTPGPILFRQFRAGRRGRPFLIYKFRTMLAGSEAMGSGLETSRTDWRITAVGAVLRNLRLDELPQLFNVLKGEMSLVGPRPLLPEFLPYYGPDDLRRLEAPPGMTGWQQVNGASRHSWRERVAFDVWYVDHRSLWLDLKILLLTAGVVFRADTSYAEDGSQSSGVPDAYAALHSPPGDGHDPR